jgi:hypothetical protein
MVRSGVLVALLVGGCGAGAPSATPDAAAPDLFSPSLCGRPGDVGNGIGVGRYCEAFSDCAGNGKATYCVRVVDPQRFFCSLPCEGDGGAGACGDGASCQCSQLGCGCTPDRCVAPPDGGARD